MLLPSDLGHQWQDTAKKEVAEHHLIERRDSLKENVAIPPQPASASRSRRRPSKVGGLRVSDKKDLIPSQVKVVAGLLINKDSISYFLVNCRLIYEGWMSLSAQPLAYNNNIEQSLIAALDIVQDC